MRQTTNISANAGGLEKAGLLLATGFGAGRSPVAPGTAGSLEGLALFAGLCWAGDALGASPVMRIAAVSAAAFLISAIGIWSANLYCRHSGLKDPQQVVIDEVAGQMIALAPLAGGLSLTGVAAGFLLFRAFDILKPFPARRLEQLPGGFGVVLDDVMAGVYAGLVVLAGGLAGLI